MCTTVIYDIIKKKNANPWENILILDVICLKFAFSKYVFCLKLLSKKVWKSNISSSNYYYFSV